MRLSVCPHLVLALLSMYGIARGQGLATLCPINKGYTCFPGECTQSQTSEDPKSPRFLIVPALNKITTNTGSKHIEIQDCHRSECLTISTTALPPYTNDIGTFIAMRGNRAPDMSGYFLKIQTSKSSNPKTFQRGDFVQVFSLAGVISVSYGNCPLPDEVSNP